MRYAALIAAGLMLTITACTSTPVATIVPTLVSAQPTEPAAATGAALLTISGAFDSQFERVTYTRGTNDILRIRFEQPGADVEIGGRITLILPRSRQPGSYPITRMSGAILKIDNDVRWRIELDLRVPGEGGARIASVSNVDGTLTLTEVGDEVSGDFRITFTTTHGDFVVEGVMDNLPLT